jgi:mannan endo-1,4-beta-mannosidase
MNRILLIVTIVMCGTTMAVAQTTIDDEATTKTEALLKNLHDVADKGVMFGHQDDQAYGIGWVAEKGRSDVKESSGSYPAVHGWDVGKKLSNPNNIDGIDFENMKRWMKDAYKRGGINTISFHMDNLTSGGDSWDKTPSVADILPGGSRHDEFLEQLDLLADMLGGLRVWFTKIPVIFRPWHEHNGNWFWWGKGNCTEEEYIALFRFTVDYLKNEKKVHNVLYAFSPDRSRLRLDTIPKQNYFYGYPGDNYVDIIGLDNYGDVGRIGGGNTPEMQQRYFRQSLELITQIADEKGKVAALTETGLEGVTRQDWFTDTLLKPIKESNGQIKIAWVLVWRNHTTSHHYAPYRGHSSQADFQVFEQDDLTFFEKDLNNPYIAGQILK